MWEFVQLRWLVHRNLVKSTRAFWPGTVVDVLLLQVGRGGWVGGDGG